MTRQAGWLMGMLTQCCTRLHEVENGLSFHVIADPCYQPHLLAQALESKILYHLSQVGRSVVYELA